MLKSASIDEIDIRNLDEKSAIQIRNPDAELNSRVHGLIERSSVEHPSASAICSWDDETIYEQLGISVQQLAHRLKMLKMGPEVTMALFFKKSLWVVFVARK